MLPTLRARQDVLEDLVNLSTVVSLFVLLVLSLLLGWSRQPELELVLPRLSFFVTLRAFTFLDSSGLTNDGFLTTSQPPCLDGVLLSF